MTYAYLERMVLSFSNTPLNPSKSTSSNGSSEFKIFNANSFLGNATLFSPSVTPESIILLLSGSKCFLILSVFSTLILLSAIRRPLLLNSELKYSRLSVLSNLLISESLYNNSIEIPV